MSTSPFGKDKLEGKTGHDFKDKMLLQRALTHSSYSNESGAKNHHLLCNERLEFLGDSVLSIIVSKYLFETFPDSPEGELTRMRAELVCERALSSYAISVGLGDYILLGVGEEKNNGRQRKSILADAFEALLAAIYLDSGESGMDNVRAFLLPFVQEEIKHLGKSGFSADAKTMLQQFVQQAEGDFLEYVTVGESGPDHMKEFFVEARLNSNVIGRGRGRSKREAEQNAAKEALKLFSVEEL
ncbi:MAG: ribonuclease III [Ruminococcaceae bacterium]|nr:ribonuclease III [Oscillospiraceae bacterium]